MIKTDVRVQQRTCSTTCGSTAKLACALRVQRMPFGALADVLHCCCFTALCFRAPDLWMWA